MPLPAREKLLAVSDTVTSLSQSPSTGVAWCDAPDDGILARQQRESSSTLCRAMDPTINMNSERAVNGAAFSLLLLKSFLGSCYWADFSRTRPPQLFL
jgi:hypothetical protein